MTVPKLAGQLFAALMAFLGLIIAGPAYGVDGGRFGDVNLVEPQGDVRGFVVLFADRGGWTAIDDVVARAMAVQGALVVEVDTDAYLKRLDNVDEKCHWPEGDAESLSRRLQRERGYANYLTPILAGLGQGGTLARVAPAQAPAATIAGAISLDPAPVIAGLRPLCSTTPASPVKGGFRYGPISTLTGFWSVGFSGKASTASWRDVEALRTAGMPVTIHQLSAPEDLAQSMATLVASHLAIPSPTTGTISGLPLIELPVDHPSKLMVVFLSGDGGWRDLDKTIAETLRQQGLPVVGWDSLRYFWSKKTPEQTAADLAAVLRFYTAKWQATKVALIGYSFGAGVLPFAYNRLPNDLRAHVSLVTLLGLDKRADFEISPSGWMGAPPSADALPVLPEIDHLPAALIQCVYGQDEDDSVCPALAPRGVENIRTVGGHHFDGDYESLAVTITKGFNLRSK